MISDGSGGVKEMPDLLISDREKAICRVCVKIRAPAIREGDICERKYPVIREKT